MILKKKKKSGLVQLNLSFFVSIIRGKMFSIYSLILYSLLGRDNDIFLPKLFWPTVGKNCSSDQEKLLKFEAEGREFAKILRSLEQFI